MTDGSHHWFAMRSDGRTDPTGVRDWNQERSGGEPSAFYEAVT
jgi:hypothetical protein